jgi:hypothetical protein
VDQASLNFFADRMAGYKTVDEKPDTRTAVYGG